MYEKTIILVNEIGLHARPASKFVNIAKQYKSSVLAGKDGIFVDAKSLCMLLSLQVQKGEMLVIKAEGDDEVIAADNLAMFLENISE
jgi:phosphocarrier protein